MTSSVQQLTSTLTDQHHQIKTMMETVLTQEGADRRAAFAELCRFLAVHEAAEEVYLHTPGKEELDGDTTVVDRRIAEEDEAGGAIAELEWLGTSSPWFSDKFEKFRLAVIAHAEAEEHEELPQLSGTLDELEVKRMQDALARVPYLFSRNGDGGTSFREQRQAACAEFRSASPTAS